MREQSSDGTRIQIQSAMLSENECSMNICIVPVPEKWLKETMITGMMTKISSENVIGSMLEKNDCASS